MTAEIRRVHYFAGQLLTPEDLEAEQEYHRSLRYLQNRLLGSGVATGLSVTPDGDGTVVVTPGIAIDGLGREIVLAAEVRVVLTTSDGPDGSFDVTATWDQVPDGFVPAPDGCAADQAFSRWRERPRIELVPTGQAAAECVVLARLVVESGCIAAIDETVRATIGAVLARASATAP